MNPKPPRNPVILVHGIFDTTAIFNTMSAYLTERGWEVHSFDLIPNTGLMTLDKLAVQLENYIAQGFSPDQPLDLVGFSMGGIVSRYYVQRLGGIERIQRFITISSPHRGTWVAYLYVLPAAAQMRPNCSFLNDLNQDIQMLEKLKFTSIWTPYDAMIVPANSSQVPVGEEWQVDVMVHAWMVNDRRTLERVEQALNS
ncbi:MAG: esterase/lipase family protein [Microcoleaceae cyanobacterium]